MTVRLTPHPDTPSDAATAVEVAVHRGSPEKLELTWTIMGDQERIRLPGRQDPDRTDDLWRHTCFELFLKAGDLGYYEFNFSPSLQWAAYRFDGYRSGMREAAPASITGVGGRVEPGIFGGHSTVDLTGLPDLNLNVPLTAGLSAVIEETDGRKSYWALAHPPGKPDFHHPIAFAREIPTVVYW